MSRKERQSSLVAISFAVACFLLLATAAALVSLSEQSTPVVGMVAKPILPAPPTNKASADPSIAQLLTLPLKAGAAMHNPAEAMRVAAALDTGEIEPAVALKRMADIMDRQANLLEPSASQTEINRSAEPQQHQFGARATKIIKPSQGAGIQQPPLSARAGAVETALIERIVKAGLERCIATLDANEIALKNGKATNAEDVRMAKRKLEQLAEISAAIDLGSIAPLEAGRRAILTMDGPEGLKGIDIPQALTGNVAEDYLRLVLDARLEERDIEDPDPPISDFNPTGISMVLLEYKILSLKTIPNHSNTLQRWEAGVEMVLCRRPSTRTTLSEVWKTQPGKHSTFARIECREHESGLWMFMAPDLDP